jgi:hypothetical protein
MMTRQWWRQTLVKGAASIEVKRGEPAKSASAIVGCAAIINPLAGEVEPAN